MCHRKTKFQKDDECAVKLPGWTNKFIGKVKKIYRYNEQGVPLELKEDDGNETNVYDITFTSDENMVNINQLRTKVKANANAKAEAVKSQTITLSDETSVIANGKAFVGDLIVCNDDNNVYRVTSTFGNGSKRKHLVRKLKFNKDDGKYEGIDSTEEIKKAQENIISLIHSYPRLTWWDQKENEPVYLWYRLNFIKMVNFLRSSFFVLSMFLMLGTGLWCILGVFIFPEKFAPYSTAIFTTAL